MRVIGNRVRLEQKIASGGMGDVWRGKMLATGADVAVKILEPSTQREDDFVERFRTEARVSALLAHRSIVKVYDLLEEKDGTLALVMELLVGRTLEERLAQSGLMAPEIAVAIVLPILGALEHAHAANVVHRDVKPANIFLAVEPDGRVTPKLLDFGVAKSGASTVKTMDGHILGTSRYVSPEQARGETLDGRSDLFSLGVVLYEAITGESPFAGRDAATALKNVIERVVDPDDRIPPRLWLVIQRALAKQSYARYASAGAFATALAMAVGKSEEELGALLREERPPIPRLETPIVAIRDAPRSRSGGRFVWPIAIGVAAFAAVFATIMLARPHAPSAAAPIAARATVPPPTQPQPTESAKIVVPATTAAPPKPTATAAATAPKPSATHPKAPKPIATTPGF